MRSVVERRLFIKRGIFGGLVLALGGGAGLLAWPTRTVATPLRPLVVLDARAFQVLIAVAKRVLLGTDADPVAIAHAVDARLLHVPPETRSDFGKLLSLFEGALPGLLFDGRLGPFTALSGDEQDKVLLSWCDSRLALRRTGYNALRRVCLVSWYVDPRSWPRIHYPGPPDTGGALYDDSKAGTSAWLAEQAAADAANEK